jgi:hypothetical protein
MDKPYASTAIVMEMFPVMVEVPTTLKASDLLFGVKTTLKREAENLELSAHSLREEDWMILSADAMGRNARRAVTRMESGEREKRIVSSVVYYRCWRNRMFRKEKALSNRFGPDNPGERVVETMR